MQRDIKIDIFKGILVIGMIYCHILQFFVNTQNYPLADSIIWYINVTTFSGFVFSFGYTNYIAYFSKPFKSVYKKIIISFVRILLAFYISGISFRVFVEHKQFSLSLVKNIILLNDIPGWSEFIISFALFILIAGVLFKPLKLLIEHKIIFWIMVTLLLFTTFIPYDKVNITQLGLFVGTNEFASFPILQYMPLYLIGIYFRRYEINANKYVFIGAVILSLIGFSTNFFRDGELLWRFPPSLFWIILPAFPLYIYYLFGYILEKYRLKFLVLIGQNTMIYLLISNILIFALSGVRGIKMLNSFTGFIANIVIISIIKYIIQMARPMRIKN